MRLSLYLVVDRFVIWIAQGIGISVAQIAARSIQHKVILNHSVLQFKPAESIVLQAAVDLTKI